MDHYLEFSKRLPDKASIFTSELEAIVSASRYVKITVKNNKFVVLVTLNLRCRLCCLSGIIQLFTNYYEILVFLHTVHKTVIFCWLPSHMRISGNELAYSAAEAVLQKDVSDCLISYTDAYQYISQYV